MNQQIDIAVISDIHGNRWALEEVLKDIKKRDIQKVLNLGDSLYGPLDPNGTAEILLKENIISISGNEDRIIIEDIPEEKISTTLKYVRSNLNNEHISWLKNLKSSMILSNEIFLCHGTPTRDNEYLLEKVEIKGVSLKKPDELSILLKEINEKIILCGHSHIQNSILLPNGKLIVNAGSVGLPAYSDDDPFPYKMEAGTPHANYTILKRKLIHYQVENISVPYDWNSASCVALKNGRPDWSKWLSTGFA
jgi:putative phosphoesterase